MRPKQDKALDFVFRMLARGVKDIVIAAPTGFGKSAISAALSFWSAQNPFPLTGSAGAYVLCTQKLLQDQYENDAGRYSPALRSVASLKTASEYDCSLFKDCSTGLQHKPVCSMAKARNCAYQKQVQKFLTSAMAVTNYAYFLTERTYLKKFPKRRLLVLDECHTIEGQLMKFVELVIGPDEIAEFAPRLQEVPGLPRLADFIQWLDTLYLPSLTAFQETFDPENLTPTKAQQLNDLNNQISKVTRALDDMDACPENWVYWQEQPNGLPGVPAGFTALAKPLSAAPYFKDFLHDTSDARIYLSAFPGSKDSICRSLGLNPAGTAMLSLGSTFPKANRPIVFTPMGSMSRTNQAQSLPVLLRALDKLLRHHAGERGLIHGHSYALCKIIFEHFKGTEHAPRIKFPTCADEREKVYKEHLDSRLPSVILSPSFTEGFDFADEAARWQALVKCPYPFLGDRQVLAMKDRDPEWYALKTVGSIVQACGRIVRSETDSGISYITDSDFKPLFDRWGYLFPAWWTEALEWL